MRVPPLLGGAISTGKLSSVVSLDELEWDPSRDGVWIYTSHSSARG